MQPLGALVGCERVHALAQSGHVTAEHPRRPPRALCHYLAPQLRRMLPPVRPAVMEGRDGRIPLAAQPLGGASGQGARPEDVRTIAWGIPPRFGRRCQVSCDDCGGGLCAQGVLLCHKALDHLLHVLEEIPASGDLHRLRRSGVYCLGRGGRPVTTDHCDPRVRLEHRHACRGGAIRQSGERLSPLEIDQYGAVVVPFPPHSPVMAPDGCPARGRALLQLPPCHMVKK